MKNNSNYLRFTEMLNNGILQNLFDGIGDAVICVDTDFRIRAFNETAKLFVKINCGADMLDKGKSFVDLFDEQEKSAVETKLQTALSGQRTLYNVLNKEGKKWYEVLYSPIFYQQQVLAITINFHPKIELTKDEHDLLYQAALVNNLSDAIIATDLDFIITCWNNAAENLYELTAREVKSRSLKEVLGQAYLAESYENIMQELLTKSYWQREVNFITKTGVSKSILSTVKHVYDNKGDKIGIVAVNKDITEIRATEKKLRFNTRHNGSVLNSLSEGVILQSSKGKITAVNKSAELLLDISSVDLIGSNIMQCLQHFFLPDGSAFSTAASAFSELLKKDEPFYNYMIYHLKKDGSKKWLSFNIQPVFEAGAVQSHAIAFSFRDVTGAREANDELEILSMVAKQTINTVIITDHKNHIKWANEGYCRLTGYTIEEITGASPDQLLDGPETNPDTMNYIQEKIKKGEPFDCEILNYAKDGHTFWRRVQAQPLYDKNARVVGYFRLGTDITLQKKMHEELMNLQVGQQKHVTRATLRAEEKQRTEIGSELHDNVNQLLASVKLYLAHLIEKNECNPSILELCSNSVNEAIEVIRRLSQRIISPVSKDIGLLDSVEQVVGMIRKTTGIKIEIRLENLKEENLVHDCKQNLFRIIQEQLNNIVKHAQATKIKIEFLMYHEELVLNIIDNGKGFDTTKKSSGVGLGNIIHRAESFNGKATFTSSPGNGCILHVTIPFIACASGESEATPVKEKRNRIKNNV